ncbi:MAG: Fe-S cluster assembly protein SufD [Calditrichia bacterium]
METKIEKIQHKLDNILNETILEKLGARFKESSVFKQIREDAFQLYQLQPLPHNKMEEWRRTDLNKVPFDQLEIAIPEESCSRNVPKPPSELFEDDILVYSCDGTTISVHIPEEIKKMGVIVAPWEEAIAHNENFVAEILQNPLQRWEYGKFISMNAAFINMGILVYVPKGVQLTKNIHNWIYFSDPNKAFFPRVTIIAEESSQISYFEYLNAPLMQQPVFINGVTEIIVKSNARVNFARIQNLEDNAYYIENGRAKVWRDGHLYHFEANMGAGWGKTSFETKLTGENAQTILDGIYFANQKQHLDQKTMQYHDSPYTYSNLNYHGVVADKAHTIYQGMIRAEKDANKVDAYQSNKNLVLSEAARADSIPGLEILANDLSCSHGATVGQIDPEQLFYLLSRGVPEEDARHLIVSGFLREVVMRIPSEKMQRIIEDIIDGKILKEIKETHE